MPDELILEIKGIDKVVAAIQRFPREIQKYMSAAGREAGSKVINTTGLKRYPPATAANYPPTPYYIRGYGTQTASGNRGNSERYGSQFYVEGRAYGANIGNRASYAKWLAGEDQARAMARIGWRKLLDVAQEKVEIITAVYQAWVDKLIADLGLK